MRSCPGLGLCMVDVMLAPGGRGMIPIETEPLLSVDAMDGCRMLSIEPDTALCHGGGGIPKATVCPLELLCELGGPLTTGESKCDREGLVSARFSSLGTGESGGEAKGAIGFGTLAVRC